MPRILIEWGDGDRRWRAPKIVKGETARAPEAPRTLDPHPQPEVESSSIGHDPTAETRERAWRNIEETQGRLIAGLRAGDEGPATEGRRFWLGGAIATFALLTGQDGDTLNRELAAKYPMPTYQGMRVKDPHTTTRPPSHAGRQRPVDPDNDEIEAFGVEVPEEGTEGTE